MATRLTTASLILLCGISASRAHYGDPNKHGCASDEEPIQIQGIAGNFCSPPCNSTGGCPTDVPPGVTATPTCALTSSSTGQKFCALVCNPSGPFDAQCGAHASCKSIQSSGLCTYDDLPVPPSSPHWAPVPSPTFQEQSACLAVGFTADGKTGWAGAGSNGVGAQIIKSTDSGKTWKAVFPKNSSQPQFNLFLATAARDEKSSIVTGVFDEMYTTDGDDFKPAKNMILSPSQDASVTPDGKFAIVGQSGGGSNTVSLSPDGSEYTRYTIPDSVINSTIFPARYGAFPTPDTWYVTAGSWPAESDKSSSKQRVTERVSLDSNRMTMSFELGSTSEPKSCEEDPDDCYAAAIVKTTDGGKTWSVVYMGADGDNVYPNGIHCSSKSHCIAALEGDSARIVVTRDGGKTWKESMHDTDKASSLVSVRMLSEDEGWVSGGHMVSLDFEGRFWHTLDGGDTWTKEAIKGLYIFSFDMVSAASGYAVALTESSGVQLMKYRHNSSQPTLTMY